MRVHARRDRSWPHRSRRVALTRKLVRYAPLLAAVLFTVCSSGGLAAPFSLGKPGEPIRLVVGFNPYFAPAWTLAVVHHKALWKKHLPPGSRVDLEIGRRGPAIARALADGQLHLAYFADAAVMLAAAGAPDVRLIAVTMMSQDLCVLVARVDAPGFADAKAGARWLQGKRIATTPGTCQGRITQLVLDREGIKPAKLFDLGWESLEQAFLENRIDAAGVPEPGASDLVLRGIAKRLTSSRPYGEWDASFIAASAELLRARPDVVNGWLEAELEAQRFIADKRNAGEVVQILASRARRISDQALHSALYAGFPEAQGGTTVRVVFPFAFTADVLGVVRKVHAYLQGRGLAAAGQLRAEAIEAGWAERVLAAHKLKSPVGLLRATGTKDKGS